MTTTKMVAIPFAFLAAAVMYSGRASAEEPMAGVEDTAEVAAAASSCPGNQIEHIPVMSGSTTFGFLDIYFDSSTGNNCAMTTATGSASGHATFIDVCLFRCKQTSQGSACTVEVARCDPGAFHFFAGPVSVHAPGQCISAFGDITFNGVTGSGALRGATHCL
jgi:hypothetical protein